jgi:hypothetical protein
MPQIHPGPILSPSVVKNVLVDADLCFPIFSFPQFPLFRPLSRRFAFFAGQNVLVLPKLI